MKKLSALLTLVVLSTLPANAAQTRHDVYNTTDTCAWITLDISSPIASNWKNVGAQYLKPGERTHWVIQATTELKVRAEPTLKADCSGGKIGDLSVIEKSPWNRLGSSETTLLRTNGKFSIRWGRP